MPFTWFLPRVIVARRAISFKILMEGRHLKCHVYNVYKFKRPVISELCWQILDIPRAVAAYFFWNTVGEYRLVCDGLQFYNGYLTL